jgi:hypothetical protein
VISSKIDRYDRTIESKVDLLTACADIPISSALIQNNTITLNQSDNYCLTSDIATTVTVLITVPNVTLCLNGHELQNGRIIISAENVTVKNGTISAPIPVSASEGDTPAITITSEGARATLENLAVICQNNSASNFYNGRPGINNAADNVQITNCFIQAGNNLYSASSGTTYGNGGYGITNSGAQVQISSCQILGGNGQGINGNTATINNKRMGAGGQGIINSGKSLALQKSGINSGVGGSIITITSSQIQIGTGSNYAITGAGGIWRI